MKQVQRGRSEGGEREVEREGRDGKARGVADTRWVVQGDDRLRKSYGEADGGAGTRETGGEEKRSSLACYGKEPMVAAGFIKLHWESREGEGGLAVWWWRWVRGEKAIKQKYN